MDIEAQRSRVAASDGDITRSLARTLQLAANCGSIYSRASGGDRKLLLNMIGCNYVLLDKEISSYQLKQPFDILQEQAYISDWLPIYLRLVTLHLPDQVLDDLLIYAA